MTTMQPIGEGEAYSFAYIDDDTKRSIRRTLLKAIAIPGYQVPFGSREMPLPYGWGTGGIQLTASIIGRNDVLKVIDQGADDTTNAVSIRRFFQRVAAVRTTRRTQDASIIQTRHRIPERSLTEEQIVVFQVPHPEPLRRLVQNENEARKLHAQGDYSLLYVKLYEDIARWGQVATPYDYPVLVNRCYVASPSPIPKFDNTKMHRNPALFIFGAGREKRIYAIPPYTDVVSLDFEDFPFTVQHFPQACGLCGAEDSYLDETVAPDGRLTFACSDTDYCEQRRAARRACSEARPRTRCPMNTVVENRSRQVDGCDGPARAETVLANARIVRPNEIVHGSIQIVDGVIKGIDPGRACARGAVDLEGDFVLPGLIDVHTDNLEKHAIPRPGVFWEGLSAAVAHDHLIVGAGITTVFDSLCVGALGKPDRCKALPLMIMGLKQAEANGLLRAAHLLHLRCDVTESTLAEELRPYADDPALRFITMLEDSLRRDPERYRSVSKRRGIEVEDAVAPGDIHERRRWLAGICSQRGIAWGNHDDTKAWHVAEGAELGMEITEFPVTLEAAKAAAERQMPIIGGAPNLVLGGSHAGGLSMRDLVAQGLLNILCSDYIPASLLQAVFTLTRGEIGLTLPRAAAFASLAPASVFGLKDRGAIDLGLRADLIRVVALDRVPMLRASWRGGQRIL